MLLTAAFSVLGVSAGAFAARLADLQVVLIPLSVVSLGIAHYLAHRRGGPEQRRQRIILWTATVLSLSFWVVPTLLP